MLKKIRIPLFILLTFSMVIILSACSKEVENETITVILPTGEYQGIYTGTLESGKPEGTGSFISEKPKDDTWTYEGDWVNGLMEGPGTYTWSDGQKYTGEFKGGLLDGEGKIDLGDGSIYECTFIENDLAGIKRTAWVLSDDEELQHVKFSGLVFDMPKKWTYKEEDSKNLTISVPGDESVDIHFSIEDSLNFSSASVKDSLKEYYIEQIKEQMGKDIKHRVVSESLEEDPLQTYTVHLNFYGNDSLLDAYITAVSRSSNTTILTVYEVLGTNDYVDASDIILKTLKNQEKDSDSEKKETEEKDTSSRDDSKALYDKYIKDIKAGGVITSVDDSMAEDGVWIFYANSSWYSLSESAKQTLADDILSNIKPWSEGMYGLTPTIVIENQSGGKLAETNMSSTKMKLKD